MSTPLKHLKRPTFALALAAMFAVSVVSVANAKDSKPATPKAGTASAGLLAGLMAVHTDDKSTFTKKHCSKKKLCSSKEAIKRLHRFNWPAAKKMMAKCLKGDKHNKIIVTSVKGDEAKDSEVKVFISCIDGQRPRPYRMHKEDGSWKLANLF